LQSRKQFKLVAIKSIVMITGLALLGRYVPEFTTSNAIPAVLYIFAVSISRLLDIRLPQGGKINIDIAVVLAAIMLFELPVVIVAVAVGTILSEMVRQFKQAIGTAAYPLSVKLITVFIASSAYYAVGGVPGTISPFSGILPITILCVAYSIFDLAFDQLKIVLRRGTPAIPALISAVKFLGPVYLSLSALGILLAVMNEGMGLWSLPLFFLPLLVTRNSFKSFLDIRNVYRKTVEALANAIEAQNPKRHGHGRRVANYSVDIAKELGIYGRELELIGYAAILHDIGMLGVDEDSLDQLLEQVSSQSGDAPHAIIGAEVVEQVDFLFDAADMIRKHHVPYDRIRRQDDVKIGSRIINVASHFDKMTRGELPEERLSYYKALNRIKKEQGIMFDPRVVRALVNVLRKQDKLAENTV
jgi:hypothetical protein